MYYGMQHLGKFLEIIADQISTGIRLLEMCTGILDGEELDTLDGRGFRGLWREILPVMEDIHWVLATLQVRMDQVRSGEALVYPRSFRPPH